MPLEERRLSHLVLVPPSLGNGGQGGLDRVLRGIIRDPAQVAEGPADPEFGLFEAVVLDGIEDLAQEPGELVASLGGLEVRPGQPELGPVK